MKRVLTILPADLVVASADIGAVEGLLEGVNAVVPLSKAALVLTSIVGVEPKVFSYRLEAADTRVWHQSITFDNAANPQMTFAISDEWRLSEFSSQRTMRNFLITLVAKYPTLEKIAYNYLAT